MKEHEEELLKDLKAAVQAEKEGRKITRKTKPAIVLENREPPEIPEFKIEETLRSNFTGEDAVWYMFRLSLFSRLHKATREEREKGRVSGLKEAQESRSDSVSGDLGSSNEGHQSEMGGESTTTERGPGGERSKDTPSSNPPIADGESDMGLKRKAGGGGGDSGSKKSRLKLKKQKKNKSSSTSPPPRQIDNRQSYERDPEVERILNEVAETINRNQTPVQRKIPSRVIRSSDHFRDTDEIRIRHSPRSRPWPTLDECDKKPLPKFLVFTSTWLSVTAKGVK